MCNNCVEKNRAEDCEYAEGNQPTPSQVSIFAMTPLMPALRLLPNSFTGLTRRSLRKTFACLRSACVSSKLPMPPVLASVLLARAPSPLIP